MTPVKGWAVVDKDGKIMFVDLSKSACQKEKREFAKSGFTGDRIKSVTITEDKPK